MLRKAKAGINPVIATVILVAVAIVIAIAVAFWASGLVGVFTRFEKIEITAAYWDSTGDGGVVLVVKNTGSSDTVIDMIMVNGRPASTGLNIALPVGASTIITVTSGIITGGVTNEIALHTTGGKTYPVAVLVP